MWSVACPSSNTTRCVLHQHATLQLIRHAPHCGWAEDPAERLSNFSSLGHDYCSGLMFRFADIIGDGTVLLRSEMEACADNGDEVKQGGYSRTVKGKV